jgi:hypothetical protein
MCQRNLRLPRGWITVVAVLFLALLGGGLSGSGRIKSRVAGWRVSDEDALKAAQSMVAAQPAVHKPVSFSGSGQTAVEHWDGQRWRVSGYCDTRPQAGVQVRTLYFVVLQYDGKGWDLEDLQLQNMELGSGSAVRKP